MLLKSFNSATGVYMFVHILKNMLIFLRIYRYAYISKNI